MKAVFKCDFCDETFENEIETVEHEKKCSRNPENKITDCTITRLSMILYELNEIIGAVISDLRGKQIDLLIEENERADSENCPFTIYQNKGRTNFILKEAVRSKHDRKGLKTTRYDDVLKHYPELYEAFKKTLERKAWNEI